MYVLLNESFHFRFEIGSFIRPTAGSLYKISVLPKLCSFGFVGIFSVKVFFPSAFAYVNR